ncbi:hypothetical protein TcasGA2_TC002514 [Tribolium castaneum]|uniref:Uncharacterized protein n=1 Tax=Tribolium castaneum TaxID=7070 RepID=D6WH68_TRICA|nr:hypothetical protein TcasGA2_TC002514 [Tribolium castaneum]
MTVRCEKLLFSSVCYFVIRHCREILYEILRWCRSYELRFFHNWYLTRRLIIGSYLKLVENFLSVVVIYMCYDNRTLFLRLLFQTRNDEKSYYHSRKGN